MAPRKGAAHRWAEFVDLRSRYQRSVHIERDAQADGWLDGYVMTPLVRSLLDRIVGGLESDAVTRAWSLTGPYGSGKSAFALYLARVLGADGNQAARKFLRAHDPELHARAFGRSGVPLAKAGLVPVLATGDRAPLEHILLRALADAAERYWSGRGRKPKTLKAIREVLGLAETQGFSIPTRQVVSFFEETARSVRDSKQGGVGLLVILDEAGKPLEHIARRGSDGSDVHLLQELAELANRSGDAPIVFVALLHQAFEQYASDLPTAQRNEWAKVQGRFADVPFQEATEQVLRLVGAALEKSELPKAWASPRKTAQAVAEILREDVDEQRALRELLEGTLPLHPLVALALGPLFRGRLAQNERSLFAFLAASEPNGFRDFLDQTLDQPELYELDRLYDYVKGAFGERLYSRQGRTWAQIENGLARLPAKANPLDARVLKTIGMLNAVGDALPASAEVIKAALPAKPKEIEESLARLRDSSHIVFRQYLNTFRLWDGSDLDLDALVGKALLEPHLGSALHQRLAKVAPPRPILVRRHSMTTGTLRFFEVRYADERIEDAHFNVTPKASRADGFVWLVIPSADREGDRLRESLEDLDWSRGEEHSRPVVIAVPHDASALRGAARELAALEWVQANTAELRDDPVARHELDGRIADAEQKIRVELEALTDGSADCDWCYGGRLLSLTTQSLTRHLSEICDEVYSPAPYIHNELLNRNHLSSAAAAARRTLMTAMVEQATEPKLGMEGNPPEYSMYRSLLEAHGLHRSSGLRCQMSAPEAAGSGTMGAVWNEVQTALAASEANRLALPKLYAQLTRPPYGLKEGVIPVIVLAALLDGLHEIAVYEEGAFVPGVTAPVVERLLRAPERFELQRFRLAGARESVFVELSKSLATGRDHPRSIVPIVRSLVRLVGDLPPFSRNTQTVSSQARRVREALLRASEPGPLLFRTLPEACDCEPFTEDAISPEKVHEFTHRLRSALRELESAYPQLLQRIDDMIREAFDASPSDSAFRVELAARARRLKRTASDAKLKSFILRAMDDVLARDEWLVSLGTLLGKKPPESWHDPDIEAAFLNTRLLVRRFRTLETLLEADIDDLPAGTALLRVAVGEAGRAERELVVTVRESDSKLFHQFERELKGLADSMMGGLPRDAIIAGLARFARDLMEAAEDAPGEAAASDRSTT